MARPIRSPRRKGKASNPNPFERHSKGSNKGKDKLSKPAAAKEAAKVAPSIVATTAATSTSTSTTDKHVRKTKPGESKRIKDAKRLASTYLEQRDGMDPDTAKAVADGLDPETLAELIVEANTAVLALVPGTGIAPGEPAGAAHSTAAPPPLPAVAPSRPSDTPSAGGILVGAANPAPGDGDPGKVPSFHTIPTLVEVQVPAPWDPTGTDLMGFADLAVAAAAESKAKNDAENRYKALKAQIYDLMKFAGVEEVAVDSMKLTAYTGHTYTLNENLLLEAGVDIELIKKGWKDTPWPDVRIYVPKAAKNG